MRPSAVLDAHRNDIRRLVEPDRARNARVFGSVLHREDSDGRDLDPGEKRLIEEAKIIHLADISDLLKLDLREDISKIKIPVTILAATYPYGMDMAKSTYEGQYKKLGRYEIEYAEGSAHFIMYDKPEWFLDQIMKHTK